ncbi:cytochrome P450 [Cubamyces menziesii]|uniref:Cytochrome P450 n=1 Tax=Trametes cubensis TaxID=1111947 RepID=A0AAD7XE02_9APHY|nr:cytochrome P450 [Cubamyces menziesii]KAJ8489414.1 hypothetical protein ONZ51_g2931 [Trametes cubensis]
MASTESWEMIGTALLVVVVVSVWRASRERRKLPPGPKGLPFVGNLWDMPNKLLERTLYEWGKIHGDVMYLRLFSTSVIVLSSIEAARDILDKRSAWNSDRPPFVFFGEMVGQAGALPCVRYGGRLRKVRQWLYDGVKSHEKLQSYQELQHRAVGILLRNLLQTPDQFMDHIHLYVAVILTEVLYGKKVHSLDHELVRVAERGIDESNNTGTPGGRLVDFFPILKHVPAWFPFAHFKREAIAARHHVDAWLSVGYNLALGTVQPCMLVSVLSQYGGKPTAIDEVDIKGLATNVYGAGVETSRSVLQMFILHMTRNPHVFRKAQEEMDRVVGVDRFPDFGDRDSLPYLKATLEEVYRWNPPLPMAVPHRTMMDDQYRGFDIPEGSMLIPNVWAMSRDARYYPNPEQFSPERYLPTEVKDKESVLLPSSFVFGFGRRVCPGQPFAQASIWLAVANIVALFDINKATDKDGNVVTPPAEFISGFTSHPVPFVCQIQPRSQKIVDIINQLDA